MRKATKQLIEEFKSALAEALPLISPVLVKKAVEGDLQAIKEVNDRVLGKPQQDITSGGDKIQIPIYGGKSVNINENEEQSLQTNNSNKKDIPTQEEN
jgi:hypothetical protein